MARCENTEVPMNANVSLDTRAMGGPVKPFSAMMMERVEANQCVACPRNSE